jgi:toxin ParE1/3/4
MPSNQSKLLLLSNEAHDDLQDILQYTLQTWSEHQAILYKEKLNNAFKSIIDNPEIGRKKDNYFAGCHCFSVGKHIIFYRIDSVSIQFVRILHESRDVDKFF